MTSILSKELKKLVNRKSQRISPCLWNVKIVALNTFKTFVPQARPLPCSFYARVSMKQYEILSKIKWTACKKNKRKRRNVNGQHVSLCSTCHNVQSTAMPATSMHEVPNALATADDMARWNLNAARNLLVLSVDKASKKSYFPKHTKSLESKLPIAVKSPIIFSILCTFIHWPTSYLHLCWFGFCYYSPYCIIATPHVHFISHKYLPLMPRVLATSCV